MKSLTIAGSNTPIKYEEADHKALDVSEGISGAFSFIRITLAKEFVMHDGGVKLPIGNAISGVIVGAGPVSRIYYASKYSPNQEAKAPDCAACDGVTPDDVYTQPVAHKCAECPNAAWGSRINDGKKAKACREYKRIVIFIKTETDTKGKLYRLDVPTTSMINLAQYGKFLQLLDSPCPIQAVCTKISFDPAIEYARLTFDAVQYLNQTQWDEIRQVMKDTTINELLTLTGSLELVDDNESKNTVPEQEVSQAKVEAKAKKTTPKASTVAVKTEVGVDNIEDIDDLDAILDDLED